ncbi:MAG: hypothetical protein AB1631_17480 [Acidobacteriota bacterium]
MRVLVSGSGFYHLTGGDQMSDDPTEKIPDEDKPLDTKLALEAILERIKQVDEKGDKRFEHTEKRFDQMELRLKRMDSRMDRMESILLEIRADVRDMRDLVKELLLQVK